MIENALLRIDGISGEPSPPFERPNSGMDFWVLELQQYDADVAQWFSETARVIQSHGGLLRELRGRGAQISLFVAPAEAVSVFALGPEFLAVLSENSISLEVLNPGFGVSLDR